MQSTARGSTVSSPARYFTADDGIEKIDITDSIEQMLSAQISRLTETQVRQPLVMISFKVGTVACWLCRSPHSMYQCPYLTLEQQLFTAYQKYAYCISLSPNLRNSWNSALSQTLEVEPMPYLARLQELRPAGTTGTCTHVTVPQSPIHVTSESFAPTRDFKYLRILQRLRRAEYG